MDVRSQFELTEIGLLPSDWTSVPIGSVCKLINGRGFKPFEWRKSGLPIIRIQNLNGSENFNYFDGLYSKKLEVNHGQLLFAWSGSRGTSFGPHVWNGPMGLLNYHTWKVEVNEERVNQEYFLHALRQLTTFIEGKAHGASALVHTQKWEMEGFLVPLPPTKAEQEAIAEALSDADAYIESLEQLIAKKRLIKQGVMQGLLTGKRRLPNFNGQWRRCKLGEIIQSCSSGATPYRGNSEFYRGPVKWITSGELNYDVIYDTLEHISKSAQIKTNLKLHPAGTFLIAITGLEAEGTRGACGIVGSPATTNQSCMAIYPTMGELDTQYLFQYYMFRGKQLALEYCQGTKQQSYTAKIVKLLPIELPADIAEQRAVAKVLSDMDREIRSLEDGLSKVRYVKQGMMQELLTGRVRLV